MHRYLSPQRSLEDLEKEARNLLHQVRGGNVDAIARWHSVDPEAGPFPPSIADVRYLIAREYGFNSWHKLKDRLKGAGPLARAAGAP